jgi:cellobiose-specific phosphotransferase system component IIC
MDWNLMNNSNLGPVDVIYNSADALLQWTEDVLRQGMDSSFLLTVSDFFDSVRWSEPFIAGLLAAHCMISALALLYRRRHQVQVGLFVAIAAVVFSSRKLNNVGGENWTAIASQNYFDSQGLFMAMFVSGPLLITANIIVVCSMYTVFCIGPCTGL